MRIFWLELKKLLNWKILLMIAVLSALLYSRYINNYCFQYGSSYGTAQAALGMEMLQKYGPEMDADEQQDFSDHYFAEKEKAVNDWIAADPDFRAAGVGSYDEYLRFSVGDKENPESREAGKKRMQAAALLGEKLTKGCSGYLEYQHAVMIVSSYQRMAREKVSVLSSDIQGTWAELFHWFTVLLLISAALLITPAMVKERRSGICGLAYTCRAGRGVFRTQFAASCAAALLASLVQGGVFALCCFAVGPHAADFAFLACDVSCADSLPFWYSLTFGKLLLAYWLMSLLLAAAYAFLSFVISSLCRNHIAAIAAQVPLLMLAMYCLSRFLFLNISSENPSQIQGIFSRVWLCAAFAAAALAVCIFLVRRRQTCEIFA